MKKSFFILSLILFGFIDSLATMQASDKLIMGSDTLYLDRSPIEILPEVCKKIQDKEKSIYSCCWNGFTAEWVIENDVLYLQNIYSFSTGRKINKRLQKILNTKFINGKIKADWVTGSYYGGFGRQLTRLYDIVYEKELLFEIKNGSIQNIEKFNSKNIEYSINKENVKSFIYRNFNWELFDDSIEFDEEVGFFIAANKKGNLIKIKIESYCDVKIEKEIRRILKLIPNWGTYYKDGIVQSFFDDYYLVFNNKQMIKFTHK
ncbi:hypothetical protein [Marinifilum caeruleilacunae]|uniref:WG repeat-containing protein n=1 Tax=Marinifilum caeruleilacunae TaxID=2499076 RepID=A0ABX1WY19_9BACT|nr:hypothetical protein [Marinifilum caeruleilacunae]NOU60811.1 hypothetical protein [Marinifilum caeruleilacunae]